MEKWNLVIDIAACTNCNNCAVATQDEFAGNSFPGYSAPGAADVRPVEIMRHVRGEGAMVDVHYVPRMCNHCDDAPCIEAAGDAIVKRPDGIVIVDPDKAKGRRDLVDACPYGAIKWNEAEQVPQNWIFDAHLLDQGWTEPRAAHVCPTRAMQALNVADEAMAKMARDEGLRVLEPERGTRPRVWYRNLEPVLSHFIGGNVTGGGRNVEGAEVSLFQSGNLKVTTQTDAFGDFRFNGIEDGSRGYAVQAYGGAGVTVEAEIPGEVTASKVIALSLD
ncbi:MAG: 4Fe-4S dicluster domain-containing protein [Sphingomonadaceae bacterium]|jgi:Fe-S-cluster-containing dehydrogenase component